MIVLSAASAATAVTEIAREFENQTNISVRVSSGSSGTLARQIAQGAPANIYVSAASNWTDQLIASGLLDNENTSTLMRNRLVFVASTDVAFTGLIDLSKPIDLLTRLDGGRISIGDPAHVPAGQYAKEALTTLGLWPAVRDRLALQTNVRAALAFVERGETPLGIVYATDVMLSKNVKIAAIVPGSAHQPILYTTSIVRDQSTPDVMAFYERLHSADAEDTFSRYGFGLKEN